MTLVVIKLVIFNQCQVIWNKITVVAAMLVAIKKGKRVDLLGGWKAGIFFRDFKSNLEI